MVSSCISDWPNVSTLSRKAPITTNGSPWMLISCPGANWTPPYCWLAKVFGDQGDFLVGLGILLIEKPA